MRLEAARKFWEVALRSPVGNLIKIPYGGSIYKGELIEDQKYKYVVLISGNLHSIEKYPLEQINENNEILSARFFFRLPKNREITKHLIHEHLKKGIPQCTDEKSSKSEDSSQIQSNLESSNPWDPVDEKWTNFIRSLIKPEEKSEKIMLRTQISSKNRDNSTKEEVADILNELRLQYEVDSQNETIKQEISYLETLYSSFSIQKGYDWAPWED
jgi:hypothetical protein